MALVKVGVGGINNNVVTNAQIAVNTITTDDIEASAITAAKFNADVISGQTELAAEPADTDEFLVSDGGVIKRVDFSHFKGGGKVLQASSAFKNTKVTTTSTSDVLVTGLEVSLTPASTGSKVLILCNLGTVSMSAQNQQQVFSFYRDIGGGGYSAIGISTGSTYNFGFGVSFAVITSPQDGYRNVGASFLDSPSTTSAVTYQVRHRIINTTGTTTGTAAVNGRASDGTYGGSSSITIMEIGA